MCTSTIIDGSFFWHLSIPAAAPLSLSRTVKVASDRDGPCCVRNGDVWPKLRQAKAGGASSVLAGTAAM